MFNPLSVLPLHLACQLLTNQNSSLENVTVDARSLKLAAELPRGYAVFPDIGMAYKYHKNQVPWNAARKYCLGSGGNLAVIDSYEKIEYVMSINTVQNSHIHVGIHRMFDHAEWTNVKNGTPVTKVPWRQKGYEEDLNRKCMALAPLPDNALFAIDCNSVQSFVCEISLSND